MPEFAIILLGFLLVSLILRTKYKIRIYNSFRQLLLTNLIFLVIGTAWDHYAIWRGHWFFDEKFLLGPKIGLMPIEEFGFIFIVPYFVLTLFRFFELRHSKR